VERDSRQAAEGGSGNDSGCTCEGPGYGRARARGAKPRTRTTQSGDGVPQSAQASLPSTLNTLASRCSRSPPCKGSWGSRGPIGRDGKLLVAPAASPPASSPCMRFPPMPLPGMGGARRQTVRRCRTTYAGSAARSTCQVREGGDGRGGIRTHGCGRFSVSCSEGSHAANAVGPAPASAPTWWPPCPATVPPRPGRRGRWAHAWRRRVEEPIKEAVVLDGIALQVVCKTAQPQKARRAPGINSRDSDRNQW